MELEAATRLRLLVMELVVSRAEHLAILNSELARSNEELDAFAYVAGHEWTAMKCAAGFVTTRTSRARYS